MVNVLLIVGGLFQLLLGVFHIMLSREIHLDTSLGEGQRAFMQALNIGGTLMVFFFAYISFLCRRELVSTHLGRAALVFMCLVYFVRALESPLLFGFEPVIFTVCIIVGLLYLIPLVISFKTPQQEAAPPAAEGLAK